MIISHRHKFIFIKTAKTAGTSIEVFLARHCGPDDVITPITPPIDGHKPRNYLGFINPVPELIRQPKSLFRLGELLGTRERFFNHMPATLVQSRVSSQIWNSYYKFCVERNPWDKVLSHYHMHVARAGGDLSLDQYLARGRFPINYFRYTDSEGRRIIVDRVVRYENLLSELGEVFSHLKIPFDGNLEVKAKAGYRTDRSPYQSVFDEQQRRIVEKAFAREIELHNYHFD